MSMLLGLDRVDWDLYPQPAWNARGEVPAAIRALATASDGNGSREYNRMLYALGNNHAGTYFPVAVPAVPFLGEILCAPAPLARRRSIDVLIDIIGSFEPEPRYREVDTPTGRRPLESLVQEAALLLSDDVHRLCTHPASLDEHRLASELLALIHE